MNFKNMDYWDKEDLATDINTSADVWRELAKDASRRVRTHVGPNPNTPEDVLRELARDDWTVRCGVAQNHNTPLALLGRLATDREWRVRDYVAENPQSTRKILIKVFEYEKSLNSPTSNVIRDLYANPNFPAFAKRVIETLFGEML